MVIIFLLCVQGIKRLVLPFLDSTSVAQGNIIRLREGDIVPANYIVLLLGNKLDEENNHFDEEIAVDAGNITDEVRPYVITSTEKPM